MTKNTNTTIEELIKRTKRTVKIDYIHTCLKCSDGSKLTKTELKEWSDKGLNEICRRHPDSFRDYIENPPVKLIKFLANCTDKKGKELAFEGQYENMEKFEAELTKEKMTAIKIVPAKGNHLCRYCMGIAEGSNKDLLCDDCKELFGHTLFTEL